MTLKTSAKSNPNSVAGAIVATIRNQGKAEVQAVGAGAVNQTIKAIAIARGFVAQGGNDLRCVPSFNDVTIDGEDKTAILMTVESIKL